MFTSNYNKGFNLRFDNGHAISVQWGKGNYCSNRDTNDDSIKETNWEASTAEVLIYSPDEEIDGKIDFGEPGNILGWMNSDEVGQLISIVSSSKNVYELNLEIFNLIRKNK